MTRLGPIGKKWYSGPAPFTYDFSDLAPFEAVRKIRLPLSTRTPQISIVIPVYNQIKLTLECLAALCANTNLSECETIIADDHSSDETPDIFSKMQGIRYHRNGENLNFLRNCNEAVKMAKGRWLVILNNDTQVQAGWLPAMMECLKEYPKAGVVGPKFIFPNGALQEAGAWVKPDGKMELIGCGLDPSLPEYSERKVVDHVSGACLLLPRELFDRVGGFSKEFAPCYYEDVDLSFKVREAGFEVIYEPKSVVVHHLSSSMKQLSDDFKSLQIDCNRKIFLKKWSSEILKLNQARAE